MPDSTSPQTPLTSPTQNEPPPAANDEFFGVMKRLSDNARLVRSAHFIAAQRKGKKQKLLGVLVVVLNVLIGSGLIEEIAKLTTVPAVYPPVLIKLLAFLAAALAGIQTFFSLQKEVECHTVSGGVYSSIYRRLDPVLADYKSNPAARAKAVERFNRINDEYLKANDDARPCIPTDEDFDQARAAFEKRRSRE